MRKVVIIVLIVAILATIATTYFMINRMPKNDVGPVEDINIEPVEKTSGDSQLVKDDKEEVSSGNNEKKELKINVEDYQAVKKITDFDFNFLTLENKKENIVYSPLSIKYALKMLEEASNGESKKQISDVLGKYTPTKYISNNNLSLANGLFIDEAFKNEVKQEYIELLKDKYDAEVKFDTFENASNINSWIKEKTLNIIPQMLNDSDVHSIQYALVNALAIDMEWVQKFTQDRGESTYPSTQFRHEANIDVYDYPFLLQGKFNNKSRDYSVMGITEVVNNYDIINELGIDNIKKIVSDDYKIFAGIKPGRSKGNGDFLLGNHGEDFKSYTEDDADEDLAEFFPEYLEELGSNYHKMGNSTDFGVYVDSEIKLFQKDLKKYGDAELEYIGIMPIEEELSKYISGLSADQLNYILPQIKKKPEDFEEGVVTRIKGTIPKFVFEYELSLKEDLKNQGIIDVFDNEKADLSNLTDLKGAYISEAKHKANIEFTQDGIKAAAVTFAGGAGGGSQYDYFFDVPVKEIDLTFNKPYLFLIRDKNSGEVWFVGTVYEPLRWADEKTQGEGGI